jgi:hypothetical protein
MKSRREGAMMKKLAEVYRLGQSPWCEDVARDQIIFHTLRRDTFLLGPLPQRSSLQFAKIIHCSTPFI